MLSLIKVEHFYCCCFVLFLYLLYDTATFISECMEVHNGSIPFTTTVSSTSVCTFQHALNGPYLTITELVAEQKTDFSPKRMSKIVC